MMSCKVHIVLILLLMVSAIAVAQQEDPAVKVQARATDHSVKLRWAPNSPSAWHYANQYGYTIERIALTVNGQVMQRPVKTLLKNEPFKPAQEDKWETYIDSDDYVAIAAQAIFGETFELTNDYKSDMVQVMNKVKELESRFSFSLFAADQSIRAAELSGLYFEDEAIEPATKYLYRIYTNIPTHILAVDTGFIFVGIQDYKPLPKIRDVKAEFDDHIAMVSWDGALTDKIYNSFWVERSDDDGKTFHKITEQPVINTFSGDIPRSKTVFKMDTLPVNDKKYFYRIIGINAFGEYGPPSDIISGSGKPGFNYSATISSHSITEKGHVLLEWTFPSVGESLLKSFHLFRMNVTTKALEEVIKDINAGARSIVDTTARSSNYYVIRSNDRYGRAINSFPYFVQLEDSVPPSAPAGLTGRIDTLGRVFLTWNANSESDLDGYHVYKSNFNSDEFNQLPGLILKENAYVDTVKLTTLTETIYYRIQAVDKRFNRSGFSQTLKLKKPDKIPPVSPVFTRIRSDSTGVYLSWNRSDSEDVVEHLVYRKSERETDWILIKSIPVRDTLSAFTDITVEHGVAYAYTILAIDDDQLESVPADPLSIRWISNNPYPEVKNIFYTVDKPGKLIRISWEYNESNVEKFLIYKANNGRPLTLFKTMEATTLELNDDLILDNNVEYRIVAAFKTGERTKFSKALIVKM